MNPCDHPHGGGNGKTSPPVMPVTPWGVNTKWTPTTTKKRDREKRLLYFKNSEKKKKKQKGKKKKKK